MSKAEAITRIDRFLSYLEKIYTPQCDCEEALIRKDDITAFVIARDALKKERPHGEWEKYRDKKEVYDLDGNKTWGQMRRCTNCGFIKTYVEDFGFYSICPNCGADMREGDRNEID